jgi:hypothetical protein
MQGNPAKPLLGAFYGIITIGTLRAWARANARPDMKGQLTHCEVGHEELSSRITVPKKRREFQ